ncbi:MAG: gliding motility-associated-like protein, partial [Bacteroidia bacterium]
VCGHEVSHAVTTNTAGLIYSYESGALNESFSDIFGNAIEFYADSTQFNWRIGEDIITSGNGIRNMANPNTHGDPDTYKGTYWRTGSGDNGGVHTNSGVQNFWFYLLTEGGSGTNDNGSTYSVDSLGIHKAGQIAYRNLTTYLTRSSNYAEARYYAIQSAVDLYGSCSKEVIATTNAWYAVGVGSEYDSSSVQANFVADTLYCFTNQLVQFFNKSVNANSYLWSFGDGNTSTAPNPSHTYASTGPHSVKLVVNGCFFGSKDTMLKAKYIQYDSLRDICSGILLPFGTWNTVHACNGFIYDNGGELDYEAVKRDTLTVDFAGSDSCVLVFQEFDYEDGYDSIYVYDGYNTSGKLIGGYTGQNLPKGGNPILFTSGAITITHFSDPYVEGSGFKAKFTSYRPTLQLSLSPDTTVCYKSLVTVKAVGSGGSKQDYSYVWNGSKGDSSISFVATRDTVIYLIFADECMKNFLYDSIKITVLDSLKLLPMNDVTLCYLEDVILVASATGGMQSDYTFTWLPFNTSINPWQTNFASDTTIFVTIQDGCTQQTDTISFRFFVRDSLTYTQSSDTLLCQGTTTTLTLTPKGGLGDFVYTSSTGTSAGPSQSFTMSVAPVGSGKHFYWIAFSDGCTNTNDTAFYTIELRDSLSIALNKDTTICYGTFVDLITTTNGGKLGNHIYVWSYATPSNSKQTVQPLKSQSFEVTLRDGCSAFEPKASIYVEVLDSLKVIILAQDTSCYGEIVNFAVDVTGGKTTSYTYNWNLGAGKLETFTKKIQTEEIVQLAVSDGCTPKPGDDSHLIRVRDPLKIIFPEDDSICYGQSFDIKPTFSGGIPSAYKVLWNEGLGSGVSKLVNPLQTTLFIGTLTDNCSTPNQDNFTLVVNSLPIVNFSINPSPYCTDRLVNFTSSVGSVGVKSLNWDFGDGSSSALPNPSHGYADPGFYTIKLEVEDVLGCRDSLIQMDYLEIVPHPRASFIFDPINADYINPFFTFQNLSDDANIFMWDFGDGTQSADVNTEHEYADTGFYAVMLIAGNEYGCPDTLVLSVRVDEVFILFYPNAFTPDNDGLNDGFGVVSRGLIEYRLVVYTRWGEILFETTDQLEKWDGKKKGVRVQSGVYPFRITGTDINGNAVLIDETVLLLY